MVAQPFNQFYTSGEPVSFVKQNRFEGRSNFFNYYPTGDVIEQKLEQIWFEFQNKRLADKRRDEETRQILN